MKPHEEGEMMECLDEPLVIVSLPAAPLQRGPQQWWRLSVMTMAED